MTLNLTKQYILIFIFFFGTLTSCSNNQENKTKELELKQKELDLKEREISLRENEAQQKQKLKIEESTKKPIANNKNKKELRYLYHANGGIIGYFSDGTIVGCPRCDFCRSNIQAMFNDKPHSTYEVMSDGSLLINNSDREFPSYNDDNGWALIDYKWNEKVPQE
ncbi:MAG: hypothetical protein IT275_02530 [Chitinophagales bacterium]|nr:hypothetical protein [Chitinophagales bacterium]